jgi:hypothetical protein
LKSSSSGIRNYDTVSGLRADIRRYFVERFVKLRTSRRWCCFLNDSCDAIESRRRCVVVPSEESSNSRRDVGIPGEKR